MSPQETFRALFAGASLVALAAPAAAAEVQTFRHHADHVLGTSFDMTVASASPAEAQLAFAAARDEVARLDRVLSAWRPTSELAALNVAGVHLASPDLYAVIAACEAWRGRTEGAFDARIGALADAWRGEAAPDVAALCAGARAEPSLDPISRTIARPAAVRFAPDGLAKGYIIDAALDAAARAAPCARGMLLDIGGDLRCRGVDAAGQAWRVGVADPADLSDNAAPMAVLTLASGQALAVSGPGMRDALVNGEARSHLIDPRTGAPAPRIQVAVVGPTAAGADALATALAVSEPRAALALAQAQPGYEALLTTADGQTLATRGWKLLEAPATPCAAPLPSGFGVRIDYEIPKIEAGNYKRPYVIVWVTDADKTPIKTLLITGTKKEWQEDNYVWWRRIGRKTPDMVAATGKPTRAPGRYSVTWDGTGADGQRLPQGRYILHIEAAREHGGHAYQSIPVDLGPNGVTASAPGKDELGDAKLTYGKLK